MSDKARQLLPEYVLGGLDEAEIREVEVALEASLALRQALEELNEDLLGLAVALPPVAPSADFKDRLFASVKTDRFLPFVDELAELCDLAFDKMKDVLRLADGQEQWCEGLPGMRLIHFEHGAGCPGLDTGLIEMEPGFEFPVHTHMGPEWSYVLEGTLIDGDGTEYGPGSILEKTVADQHLVRAGSAGKLVYVVIHNGLEIQIED